MKKENSSTTILLTINIALVIMGLLMINKRILNTDEKSDSLKQKINQAVDFVDAPSGQMTIASLPPYPVSSTLLREQLLQASASSSLLTEFMSPQVLDYIYQQHLYR